MRAVFKGLSKPVFMAFLSLAKRDFIFLTFSEMNPERNSTVVFGTNSKA